MKEKIIDILGFIFVIVTGLWAWCACLIESKCEKYERYEEDNNNNSDNDNNDNIHK